MKSKRGIYYDLKESTYVYNLSDFKFFFSSKRYLEKFEIMYEDEIKRENLKLSSFYNCNINADVMIVLDLYKTIEKRGFRVVYKNKELNENYLLKVNL